MWLVKSILIIFKNLKPEHARLLVQKESLNVILGELDAMEKPLSDNTRQVLNCAFVFSFAFFISLNITVYPFIAITDDALFF